ncbi:hypothetical protein BH18ACI4_BH18ACI4_13320 [soil metagenome]
MSYKILLTTLLFLLTLGVTAQAQQAPSLGTFDPHPRYLLNPGDVVEVQYRYTPEFNQTVTIQPDGFVSLQIVGDVKISGLTLEQVQGMVRDKASSRLKDPVVMLVLKEFQKPYFVVAGEVVQPGKIEMREKVTALQAVMLAGGFKDSAKSSQILLFRKVNSEIAEVKVLNLKKIRRTSDLERDLALQPGDMLFVPENTITKIGRFMRLANIGLFFNPLDVLRR